MSKVSEIARGAPALLLLLAGCAHLHRDQESCCRPLPGDLPAVSVLPVVARGRIAPDVRRLPPFATLDESLSRQRNAVLPYRDLSPRDCQCLAARASSLGNLLEKKASSCAPQGGVCRREDDPLAGVQQGMIRDAALEARNRSAGSAMELYFRLAEAEGKYDILRQSLVEIEDALANGERMKAKGMQLGDDFEILRRRRVATLDSDIELELTIERINAELKHLLSLGPVEEAWRIWPDADWTVVPDPVDMATAQALGLARRPELILLRALGNSLSRDTATAVRTILSRADALLGMSCGGTPSLVKKLLTLLGHPATSDEEVEALCRQFQTFRIERERAVAEEVRLAVLTVGARLRQVAVAREEVEGWERRLDELKAKAEQGMSTFPERTTVDLRRLEAQGNLIQDVMAWNIARVKLAEAQGILAEQCGFVNCAARPPQ